MGDTAVDHFHLPGHIVHRRDLNVGFQLDVDLIANLVLHLIQSAQDQLYGRIAQLGALQHRTHLARVIELVHPIIHLHQIRLHYE